LTQKYQVFCRSFVTIYTKGDQTVLHEPATPSGKDAAAPYKSRLGVWMFLLYCLFYASFVALNLYNPLIMETHVCFGLNLATVYGFGLIIVALILALIYDGLCRKRESDLGDHEHGEGDK
jgi:uncharacterized membrane protein (DUF485 family)